MYTIKTLDVDILFPSRQARGRFTDSMLHHGLHRGAPVADYVLGGISDSSYKLLAYKGGVIEGSCRPPKRVCH